MTLDPNDAFDGCLSIRDWHRSVLIMPDLFILLNTSKSKMDEIGTALLSISAVSKESRCIRKEIIGTFISLYSLEDACLGHSFMFTVSSVTDFTAQVATSVVKRRQASATTKRTKMMLQNFAKVKNNF